MKRFAMSILMLAVVLSASAQKPSLDHSVYDGWKSVSRLAVPCDGEWAQWTVAPQEGDIVLHLYNIKSGKEYVLDRASGLVLSEDASSAAFKIAPMFKETRQAKIDKKKPDQMPKDSLGIIDLKSGKITRYPMLKSFKTGDIITSYVAFLKAKGESKDKKAESYDTLYVLNVKTMTIDTIGPADNYIYSKEGDKLAYLTNPGKKDSLGVKGVFLYDPAIRRATDVLTGDKKATFKSMYFNDEGDKLVFFGTLDTAKDAKKSLSMYIHQNGTTSTLVENKDSRLPKGWKLSDTRIIEFHKDFLTFGTMPIPREKDTTLVDFEQPKLDIWTWNEDYIQPIQKVNNSRELHRSYQAKVGYDGKNFVQMADFDIPEVSISKDNVQDVIIARTDKPYRVQQQWDQSACSDIWRISLKDGSRTLVEKKAPYTYSSESPDGAYMVAFNEKDNNWYLYDVASGKFTELTSKLGVDFWDVEDDHPTYPGAWGRPIWDKDSKFFWIPDQYDLWQLDPAGKVAPFMVTEGKGRASKVTYRFANPYDEPGSNPFTKNKIDAEKPVYFTMFDHVTKEHGYAVKDLRKKKAQLTTLVKGPYIYNNLAVSEGKKGGLIYTRECFEDGRNVWITRDNFKSQNQLSDVNPQQRDYNWGTVELLGWKSEDGRDVEGLLYKPENFDPNKKYPVLIYFYERNSDDLYLYKVPQPSASTINIPYFVSNEYLVFVPDLWYTDGHPGESCMKCLMPGCDMLCEYPWVDGDNMAVQGQSWGGYQVAYIITHTTRFKAAGAGAPVSNMTSAYGGIRWESGLARTFQYEQQQSRIGDDLWHGFDLYVENSPLFFVPNVTTPVLIMHNDADGAVPWWQGIEFFNGLRRCGKQAWLLQYNDEAHNLRERRNRKDLSIRLEQFFGHFLKGQPMPVWMSRGVPMTLKGIDYGYGFEEN